FKGRGDDFLFALGDFGGLLASATASTTSAALLGLRELTFIGLGLNEHHVGVRFGVGVFSGGVETHQVAWNQLEIFESQRRGAVSLFCALMGEQVYGGLGPAVDGIMQCHATEPVFVRGFG